MRIKSNDSILFLTKKASQNWHFLTKRREKVWVFSLIFLNESGAEDMSIFAMWFLLLRTGFFWLSERLKEASLGKRLGCGIRFWALFLIFYDLMLRNIEGLADELSIIIDREIELLGFFFFWAGFLTDKDEIRMLIWCFIKYVPLIDQVFWDMSSWQRKASRDRKMFCSIFFEYGAFNRWKTQTIIFKRF